MKKNRRRAVERWAAAADGLAEAWLEPSFFTASRGEFPIIWVSARGDRHGSAFHVWTQHGVLWLKSLEKALGFEVQLRLLQADATIEMLRVWPGDNVADLPPSEAAERHGKSFEV